MTRVLARTFIYVWIKKQIYQTEKYFCKPVDYLQVYLNLYYKLSQRPFSSWPKQNLLALFLSNFDFNLTEQNLFVESTAFL